MSYFRLFAVSLSAILVSYSAIAQQASTAPISVDNTPVTRGELPALIRQTLINDPTIFMDVVEKIQKDQEKSFIERAKEGITKYKNEIYSAPNSPVTGNPKGDVTLVEFFDYHCGYCKLALKSVNQLLESDKNLKIVFKEYPILSEDSKLAAKAALAVNNINKAKYFDFHKALFASTSGFSEEAIMAEASKLGIDTAKLKEEMSKAYIEEELEQNKKIGAVVGIQGTPAMIIGDEFFPGAVSVEKLKEAIAKARATKK